MSGVQVNIYGFVDIMRGLQDNYVLTEGHWLGEKSANGTCSIEFHRWTTNEFATKANELISWTDSCAHEFKCFYTVWWYLWFVIVGKAVYDSCVTKIRHVHCLPGHTKFGPDQGFGLLGNAMKRESIFHPCDLFQTIATQCGPRQRAIDGSSKTVTYYDFKVYLAQFFDEKKKIPQIKSRHEFLYDLTNPGVVQFRASTDKEFESLATFKPGVTVATVLHPEQHGLKPLSAFILPAARRQPARVAAMKQVTDKYKNVDVDLYFSNCVL
jgi:hypothetical protein